MNNSKKGFYRKSETLLIAVCLTEGRAVTEIASLLGRDAGHLREKIAKENITPFSTARELLVARIKYSFEKCSEEIMDAPEKMGALGSLQIRQARLLESLEELGGGGERPASEIERQRILDMTDEEAAAELERTIKNLSGQRGAAETQPRH